ncbi:PQQ-binding-like beta-propeller repeat protein [Gordonia phthalatica]|uniref:Pyrrolo-quinoline quinone n=1 Tax=Gordonia phthalatica TaxID=1136941 RepID=A0A0N9NFL1_9ACTN|nr:PQQ-binding-like beta-propeller repeat protein [Gordonia phthalatica]ALG84080.1 pyrrolo-quinoline quinone [Gordonia phthalatica]
MTQAARRRMRAFLRAAFLGTLTALVVTSCSDGHLDVRSVPAAGWSSYGGNSANSNFTWAQPPADLAPSWTRDAGGTVTSPIVMNGGGDVVVSARTARGCNFTVLDYRAGRKNFCKRLADGFWGNAAVVDQFSQPYIGEPGRFLALTGGGSIRWRHDGPGTPTSAKFVAPGQVLVTTTQGGVSIFNSQTGDLMMPELKLWPTTAEAPAAGLADCVTGGPACAISAPPAVDWGHKRIVLNYFPQGAKTSQVKALGYNGELSQEWTADLPLGVVGPPVVSNDGKTVYAFARDNKLYALDAATGKTRWSHDVGDAGFATMSVSPDGVIIPAGKLGAPLTILKDEGDAVTEVARRDDLQTAGLSTQTTTGTAWAVVRTGADQHLELIEVDTKTGATKRTLPMPESKGFATGIAVSPNGQIAVATYAGTVYYFDAKS